MSEDGKPDAGAVRHVIFLVHGIRTHGEWATRAAAILESQPGLQVRPIRYGYFDLFRFLVPGWPRSEPVRRVTRLMRDELSRGPVVLSVIAHSFGTYIIGRILRSEPDIHFKRLLLCGSILPDDFEWENFGHRIAVDNTHGWQVVNDCGMRDRWPVYARFVTRGYGASGRFGFGHPRVKDRFYEVDHSGFFTEDFVRSNWVPWFTHGKLVDGVVDRPTTSPGISLLGFLNLPVLAVVVAVLGWVFFYKPSELVNPLTGSEQSVIEEAAPQPVVEISPPLAAESAPTLGEDSTPELAEDASVAVASEDIEFGDDASLLANNGFCDDPRFETIGATSTVNVSSLSHDATDCRALHEAGQLNVLDGVQEATPLSGSYSGRLEASDPLLPGRGRVDRYRFAGGIGNSAVLDLQSDEFDPYLRVETPSGEVLDNEDFNGSKERSQLILDPIESGYYMVQVVSRNGSAGGAYTLDMTQATAQLVIEDPVEPPAD